MFNSFVWDQKKPRIKAALLQKPREEGGIALPNVLLCYQAAVLEHLVQWWSPSVKQSWEIEQLDVPFPLTEWVLSMNFFPFIANFEWDCSWHI